MPENIALIGFMGAGKSTVGEQLAKGLCRPFFDIDREIELFSGMAIPQIFAARGEPAFRAIEADMCRKASRLHGHIIATGGGIVENPDNITALRASSIVIYLEITPQATLERIADRQSRPMLALHSIEGLMSRREPLYRQAAHHTINAESNIADLVQSIMQLLR